MRDHNNGFLSIVNSALKKERQLLGPELHGLTMIIDVTSIKGFWHNYSITGKDDPYILLLRL